MVGMALALAFRLAYCLGALAAIEHLAFTLLCYCLLGPSLGVSSSCVVSGMLAWFMRALSHMLVVLLCSAFVAFAVVSLFCAFFPLPLLPIALPSRVFPLDF